jgi:hypothetical protein
LVRQLLARRGIDASTTAGREHARRYLRAALTRMVSDLERHLRLQQAARVRHDLSGAYAERMAYFSARGLSSDTSLLPAYGIEQALTAMKAEGALVPGGVRRVAIVGPGLDYIDKVDGYDVYPQQSLQPFLVIDSLLRLGLAVPGRLQVVTLDLNPRVNEHLAAARHRAGGYHLQLPKDGARPWTEDYVSYWQRSGNQVGTEVETNTVPVLGATVLLRRLRIRPEIVEAVTPADVNIVFERLAGNQPFDLLIATNVLVYYGIFEQALALNNITAMVKPGGWFVSNEAVPLLRQIPLEESGATNVVYATGPGYSERLAWYRRQ